MLKNSGIILGHIRQKSWYPWLVVGLLWGVALLNYMDRQMLSTMKSAMMMSFPGWAVKNWLPTLFSDTLGIEMSRAGPLSTITIAFSSFAGALITSWLGRSTDAGSFGRDMALLAIPVAIAVILLLATIKPTVADRLEDFKPK